MVNSCRFLQHFFSNSKWLSLEPYYDFINDFYSGAAGVLAGHPLDTVKVRLQTQCASNPTYRGTVHCFTTIAKAEKVQGLYKGKKNYIHEKCIIFQSFMERNSII